MDITVSLYLKMPEMSRIPEMPKIPESEGGDLGSGGRNRELPFFID